MITIMLLAKVYTNDWKISDPFHTSWWTLCQTGYVVKLLQATNLMFDIFAFLFKVSWTAGDGKSFKKKKKGEDEAAATVLI